MKHIPGRTIQAKHTLRTNADGTPRRKVFPLMVWERLPKIHMWKDGEKIEVPKQGWVEDTEAPKPLKEAAKAAPAKEVGKPTPVAQPSGLKFEVD